MSFSGGCNLAIRGAQFRSRVGVILYDGVPYVMRTIITKTFKSFKKKENRQWGGGENRLLFSLITLKIL